MRERAHSVAIVAVELMQIGRRIAGKPLRQRLNVIAFHLGSVLRQRLGLLDRVVGLLLARRIDWQVVIWTQRLGDAPVSHPQIRIQLGGAPERLLRFNMVEAVNKVHALVEECLGLGVGGGDVVMNVADTRHELDRRGGGGLRKQGKAA